MNRSERRKILKTSRDEPIDGNNAALAVALRDQALSRHRSGQLAEAIAHFNQSLAIQDQDSVTHHGLGLALRDNGDTETALHHLQIALSLSPQDVVILNNLGGIHFAAGRFHEARQAFETALKIREDWQLLWRNLGACWVGLDVPERAIAALSHAVKLAPDDSWAHYHFGRAAMKLNDAKTAIVAFREALNLDPTNSAKAIALAELFEDVADFPNADVAYRHALAQKPDDAAVILKVARRLTHLGKPDEALILLNYALELIPDDPNCTIGLAWAHRSLGTPEFAESLCRETLERHPDMTDARFLLGFLRMEAGDMVTAKSCFGTILLQDPDHNDTGINDAYLDLAVGNFEIGWRKFETRLKLPIFRFHHHTGRRWSGESLADKTILIEAEQGYGDAFQFIRYVPLVAQQAGHVLLRVAPPLAGLLAGLPDNVSLIPWEGRINDFDFRIELMSLPLMFGTTLENVPKPIPYLSVDQARIDRWSEYFADETDALKVGIVWAGNPDHQNDCNRSMPISALAPLTAIPGIKLYSLQVGPRALDLANLPEGAVQDLSSLLSDFTETGAALSNLDLVISVDTSVVHLAGALGRPAWLLLSTASEWRWLRDREDSPWYPSLRLFRQSAYRDWPELVARVAKALEAAKASGGLLS